MYYAGAKASVGEDVNRRLAGGDQHRHYGAHKLPRIISNFISVYTTI
jgi:hypothetical protein